MASVCSPPVSMIPRCRRWLAGAVASQPALRPSITTQLELLVPSRSPILCCLARWQQTTLQSRKEALPVASLRLRRIYCLQSRAAAVAPTLQEALEKETRTMRALARARTPSQPIRLPLKRATRSTRCITRRSRWIKTKFRLSWLNWQTQLSTLFSAKTMRRRWSYYKKQKESSR